MKKRTRRPTAAKNPPAGKRRRGRPRLTEAQKTANPVRNMMREIKAGLKQLKKSKRKLDLLIGKAQIEQSVLLSVLLDNLEKIRAELKKKPKQGLKKKPGKRGRPRKSALKPGRKTTQKAPVKTARKRGRPRKEIQPVSA